MLRKASLTLLAALAVATAARAGEIGSQEFIQLLPGGAGSIDRGALADIGTLDPATEFPRVTPEDFGLEQLAGSSEGPRAASAPTSFPVVENSRFALVNRGFSGFDGLNHADQRLAGTGAFTNSQFSLEPPDQGLCVGNGFVIETVNTAIAIFRAGTAERIAGPTPLNQFFGLAPEVIRANPPVFGDFTSDPRCFFDRDTNRFFVILLQLGVVPRTGNFTGASSQLIAVSKSGDPTQGFNFFRLDTTAHGTRCPCFGDQPLMGQDANGFFLSANAFSLVTGRFVGVQIYAMSKRALAAGVAPPFVVRIALPAATQADGTRDISVQPAFSAGTDEDGNATEFFLASANITQVLNNSLSVFAFRSTAALAAPLGPGTTFSFTKTVVPSQVFGVPPDAEQKQGTFPLGSLVNPKVTTILATNEHRMQQVTFADGKLWSAVTTGLSSPGEADLKAGVAWFAVGVKAKAGRPVEARVKDQGYIAVPNASAFFPAVGVGREGDRVAIGFSVSGPGLFPSAGYALVQGEGQTGRVHLAAVGANSEDGFTAYPSQTDAPCTAPAADGSQICEARWGDYGAAAVDEQGNIWMANEYISPRPRTVLANWGTFVSRLTTDGD
ncbi:MAG: hypothetical protein E6J62_07010 [Deltaproteobacteria bacterium]|nr:MAG: hypothetical protein E6J85_06090 [Deltaproteobacteria bacterium]TMB30998.1 MAG: hypothetical protein E6J61_11375 [Deltaproteobacteria bacterium]TMB36558.1 MAG: hypothetical protein E6J62_07010 [Deltaproteobacteria bacterium]